MVLSTKIKNKLKNINYPWVYIAVFVGALVVVIWLVNFDNSKNSNTAQTTDDIALEANEEVQNPSEETPLDQAAEPEVVAGSEPPAPPPTTPKPTQNQPVAAAPQPDTTPPTAPTNLTGYDTADNASYGYIHLSWSGSMDNVGVAGYRIYKDGELLADVPGGTTQYSYQERCMWHYKFIVKAYDSAGNLSAPSNEKKLIVDEGCPI